MNKTFRQLEKDFAARRDVGENWDILRVRLSSCYYTLAGIELYMNYYTLCGRWSSWDKAVSPEKMFGAGELRGKIEECIDGIHGGKDVTAEIEAVRETIISRTKAVLAYSDIFQLYEYVLNRLEPSYLESLQDIDNDETARQILNEIFANKDNFIINENIKHMVLSLPIRMTRQHFFDVMHEALSEYIGAPYDSFEKMLFFIRSSSGIKKSTTESPIFDELRSICSEFESADYRNLSKEQHAVLTEKLKYVVRLIIDSVEAFRALEEIANEILVMMHTKEEASDDAMLEVQNLHGIFTEAREMTGGAESEITAGTRTLFESIEGRLEYYIENMQRLEMLLGKAGELDEINTDRRYRVLSDCRKLMSESLFVELDEDVRETPLEEKEFDDMVDELIDDFSERFETDSKLMMRARMAFALNQLPVFFKSRTAVMNYVREALESCHDVAEKLVAVRMFLDGIVQNDE